MPDEKLPLYPNYRGTFGTGLAVVTALMASISIAIVVVFSADQVTQACLGFLPLTPDQAGTIAGSLATVLFVAATLASVYAQAANRYEVPQAIMAKWFTNRTDEEDRTADWDKKCETAYRRARVLWVNGISLFLLATTAPFGPTKTA